MSRIATLNAITTVVDQSIRNVSCVNGAFGATKRTDAIRERIYYLD